MNDIQRTTGPAIKVEALDIGFGKHEVLKSLSLEVEQGCVYALLGRNGAGKTTLVRALLGQIQASSQELRVLGSDPWSARQSLMEEVGYVPEVPDIPPELRLASVITLCSCLHCRWNAELANSRLDHFGLALKRQFSTLSRGQKAQLQLILALSFEPRLLILDDPTLGLDAIARRELYEEVIRDLADRGTTVFLTTHDLDGVERLADRVGILDGGRLLCDSSLGELKTEWSSRLGGDPALEEILIHVLSGGGVA